ncbi:GTP-binding protein [Plasmodium brasilianum]|uniref:GTP-binding protein n=1 Tax=Plasmodium brasilianum TaxID=5824 RepID=A0ACB9Y4N2_PLABR|nr:GTP-binding protein [Plasmodium brasilianum]
MSKSKMFLRVYLYFVVFIFLIYTKCNSYFLKKRKFENLFFVNYNVNSLNINENKNIKAFGKTDFHLKLSRNNRRKNNDRYRNNKNDQKNTYAYDDFPRCFLLPLNRRRQGYEYYDETWSDRAKSGGCVGGREIKKQKIKNELFMSNFEKIFKENFSESDRLKKTELVSILACICTNIVIEYLKIKEERKTEDFEYSFDYSIMNLLRMNEKKKKNKISSSIGNMNTMHSVNSRNNHKIDSSNNCFYRSTTFVTPELVNDKNFLNNDKLLYKETEEEVNVNIDNKNTKEENEKLDEYIKKIEYNTLEIREIEPYINLFFGKDTYKNVFVKYNIDIHKIYNTLNTSLLEKCQEKENVMQLQKFVEQEERNLLNKNKKINVRNVRTFDNYLDKFSSLEERRNINEVQNILNDGDYQGEEEEEEEGEDLVPSRKEEKEKEKKKKKNRQTNKRTDKQKDKNIEKRIKYQEKTERDDEGGENGNEDIDGENGNEDIDGENGNEDIDGENGNEDRDGENGNEDRDGENGNEDRDGGDNIEESRGGSGNNYNDGGSVRSSGYTNGIDGDGDVHNEREGGSNQENAYGKETEGGDKACSSENRNNKRNDDRSEYGGHIQCRGPSDDVEYNNKMKGKYDYDEFGKEEDVQEKISSGNYKRNYRGKYEERNERNERNETNDMEHLNCLSYALVKSNDKGETDSSEEKEEEEEEEDKNKDDIILIKFVYNNKYKCEFRTDVGVIAYEDGANNFVDDMWENIKEGKMHSVISNGNSSSNRSGNRSGNKFLNDVGLRLIDDAMLDELQSLPSYKKRFYKKQNIIKEINNRIVKNKELNEENLGSLLYIYLNVWGDDLHFYELKKLEINYLSEEKKNGLNDTSEESNKLNFLCNYNYSDKEEILIDSDIYNKIINKKKEKGDNKSIIYYKLLNEHTFFENDYISFNLKVYINNRKEINNYNTLISTLKLYNSNLSKNIQRYLDQLKEENNMSFMSFSEFLKNYCFSEKDEFFNMNEILQKCKVENKYFNLFSNSKDEVRKGGRNFKLFYYSYHGTSNVSRGKRGNVFWGCKKRGNVFWGCKKRGLFFGTYRKMVCFSACAEMNKRGEKEDNNEVKNDSKDKRTGRRRNKRTDKRTEKRKNVKDAIDGVDMEQEVDEAFSAQIDEELESFENIDSMMDLKIENNREETNNKESTQNDGDGDGDSDGNGNGNDYDKNIYNEKSVSSKEGKKNKLKLVNEKNNGYLEKMLERQRSAVDFLSLERINENVKKYINIANYEEVYKQLKNEAEKKSKPKKVTSEHDSSNQLDIQENNVDAEEEIEKRIKQILKNNNNDDLRARSIEDENDEKRNDEDKEKSNKEKEKERISEFFKSMNVKVQLSKDTCIGCGITFQSNDNKKFGFLKNHIYEKIINKDDNLDEKKILSDIYEQNENENEKEKEENYRYKLNEIFRLREEGINKILQGTESFCYTNMRNKNNDGNKTEKYELDKYQKNGILMKRSKEEEEVEDEEGNNKKAYICERCFDLKYKNRINNNLIINYINNNEISAQDFEKYVINIFKKRCSIIYIVDILDLYVYSNLKKLFNIYMKMNKDKKMMEGFYFCVNKIDLLPGHKEFTVKNYVYNFLKNNKINILFKNIFLVSSKTGYNVKKLIFTACMRSWIVPKKKDKKSKQESSLMDRKKMDSNYPGSLRTEEQSHPTVGNILRNSRQEGEEVDDGEAKGGETNEGEANEGEANEGEDNEGEDNEGKGDEGEFYWGEAEKGKGNSEYALEKYKNREKKQIQKKINIYIVGNANSGKSSLINYLLKNIEKKDNKHLSISNSIIPGTTLKNIQIKLNKNITINDTPGIISHNSLLSYLNFDELKHVVCTKLKKKIPSIYINENDFIFIGGILYIQILSIKKFYSIMSFFMSEKIPIIKRKNFSKDATNFLKEKIKNGFLYPPFSVERFDQISDFKKCYFSINNPCADIDSSNYDIYVQGLGSITFYSFQSIEFNLYTLKNVDVVSRPSLVPYHKKYGMLDFSKNKL